MLLCSFLYLHICSSCYSFFSKRRRRKETEYAAMHTFARFCYSSSNARARRKEKKKRDDAGRRRRRRGRKGKIFARTATVDDLREQIDRDAFAMRSYAAYSLRGRRRRRRKKKKEENGNVHYLFKREFSTKSPDFIGQRF